MTRQVWNDADVAAERQRRHGLADCSDPARDVATAARRSAGLQAQDLAASRLAVRPRTRGLTAADVARACDDGTAVRTWLMRGTLHLVPAADVRWLVRLLGPTIARRDRGRRERLGLDAATCDRALRVLPEVLAGGGLTRADLVAALARAGVRIPADGQAPAHLVLYAAASGAICRGPDDGDEPTYTLLDRWVPNGGGPDGAAAVAELARRHLAAYAPVTVEDLAAWAGIPLTAACAGVRDLGGEVAEVATERGPRLVPAGTRRPASGTATNGSWRLLPAFDAYLLGYADRRALLDPAHARRVNAGGGWLHPLAVRDGRVAGTWRLKPGPRGARVAAVELFDGPPDARATEALEAEARDAGRFLGTEVTLSIAG
jgi:hypothetical protein